MNIKLSERIGKINIDLRIFKKVFTDTFNLKLSFTESIRTIKIDIENEEEEKVLEYIFHGTNWNNFFKYFLETNKESINFTIYKCECQDFLSYTPNEIDIKSLIFSFDQNKGIKDGFLVINDFIEKMESHIEDFIGLHALDYVEKTWTAKY